MNLANIVVKEIQAVMTVYSPKGRTETMHNRSSYGVSFTAKGQITYTHNNKSFVSDENNFVILPKGQTYQIHGDRDGLFYVINFECENFSCDTITVLPMPDITSVVKDFEEMKMGFIHKNKRLLTIGIFYNLLYRISNSLGSTSNPSLRAIDFIDNNFSSDITNKTLAESCHLNEEYFRKQFKKTYGISPKQYLINTRLNMAKQMLSEGILKINIISEKCGFSNPYHFCKLFKDKIGVTPSEYMKMNKTDKI
ncbi:MAG: helix-turn-helix transcriptional regulator [Clostridia bacterium]|nr:helix-turn-helix transcriptional regulator [Clostridia bacterium]